MRQAALPASLKRSTAYVSRAPITNVRVPGHKVPPLLVPLSAQRAPPTRGGQAVAVIWLFAKRNQARTADSQREWHTHTSGLSVSSRCCWCWCARCARERSGSPLDDTLSQRELPHSRHTGTLQLHALQHMYVPCRLLSSLKMSLKVKFESFCANAAHGRLADVQRMLESGELLVDGNLNDALVRAAENGHVDVVDCLLRHAMFDPSADDNYAIRLATENGHLAVVGRLLRDERVDPSVDDGYAVRWAALHGHLAVDPSAKDNSTVRMAARFGHTAVVERLLQDERVDPTVDNNYLLRWAAANGRLAVVEWLLQDARIDPSADDNYAVRLAADGGHLAVVERLLQDARVDPSADDNDAVGCAAVHGHFAVVDRLLEDDRVDVAVAMRCSHPEDRKHFECRERLAEICIALQDLELPAWVTVQILDAARPWSTLALHSQWSLVCAVKHFREQQ